jgi:hypothetical protein
VVAEEGEAVTPPITGRWWLDTDAEGAEQSIVGEDCQMLVGVFPDVRPVVFTVVRVDRLRNKVLLEVL